MNILWRELPSDIICKILQYNGSITYRTGIYINKIQSIEDNYHMLVDSLRFHRYRRYLSNISFATFVIANTEKQLCFIATKNGMTVTIYDTDPEDEHRLFSNVTKHIVSPL